MKWERLGPTCRYWRVPFWARYTTPEGDEVTNHHALVKTPLDFTVLNMREICRLLAFCVTTSSVEISGPPKLVPVRSPKPLWWRSEFYASVIIDLTRTDDQIPIEKNIWGDTKTIKRLRIK